MIKIGIVGASGRIGQLLIEALSSDRDAKLESVFVRNELSFSVPKGVLVTNDLGVFLNASDLVIDFSSPQATQNLLDCAIDKAPKPLVIGTTGLNKIQFDLLSACASKMPVLYSSNMSRGVSLLNKLASITAASLKESDIEISEIHHRNKKDSPSGTALNLAKTCAKARNLNIDEVRISGRDGAIGPRKNSEIAVMAFRGGDVVGRHTVGFYLDGEYIELTHNATSRMTFAKGALDVGKWLIKQPNGLYSIENALE